MYKELLKKWKEERLTESVVLEMGVAGVLALKDFADWLDKSAAQQSVQATPICTCKTSSPTAWCPVHNGSIEI